MVKNPNWQEADQLAIYKRGRGVELGATEKQLQLAVRAGLEPGTSGFQVRRPNHSTTLPPTYKDLSEKCATQGGRRTPKGSRKAHRARLISETKCV